MNNSTYAHVRVQVWRSWLFARAEKYFSARANSQYFSARAKSQLRQTRVLYVIDEGSCDESR